MKRFSQNTASVRPGAVVMYVDMNSFFASCEQQDDQWLQGRPVGVCTHESPHACVIAPSVEAKAFGVKTGMRLHECRQLCPQIIPVVANPVKYRQYHLQIMQVLRGYCDEVIPKSIDEAVLDFTSYRLVYKDFPALAAQIRAGIAQIGAHLRCSIGIAPNVFLAKLGTELQKPDGLIRITPENLDTYLAGMKLSDLPGIARRNERRLQLIGIRTPLELRYASPALLRKAFGGITGHYWHCRLNFMEVDMYKNDYRAMSAMRTVSPQQRASPQALESLLIALCSRLEQRMVKQEVFCREAGFFIRYRDHTGWDTRIRFQQPVQDGMDIRDYILQEVRAFERQHAAPLLTGRMQSMGVYVQRFVSDKAVAYTLFDNNMRRDQLRRVLYSIRDRYGKNSVRKAVETIVPDVLRDAIGFGSVKDLYEGERFNKYLVEEDKTIRRQS